MEPIPERTDEVARDVVDSLITVHRALGPGLLESVYEICLCAELSARGVSFRTQVELPIVYRNLRLDAGLKLDVIVEDCLILELKSIEQILPVHEAQLLTYLKLTGIRLGLLINFNVPLMKNGIQRFAK